MKTFLAHLKTSLLLTLVLAILLCGAYPLLVWGAGQALFSAQANGSLIVDRQGEVRGSSLLAQNFTSPKYFQPRPSAAGTGYDATGSSGTNLGPTSDKLANGSHAKDRAGKPVNDPNNFDGVKDLVAAYRSLNGLDEAAAVPADAVTRSASGLDPHISLANANLQARRVAQARHLPLEKVQALMVQHTAERDLGLFGEPGVNVLLLNNALDALASSRDNAPAKSK
jgi:K+-transporting ATPase ATPase C chain